MSWWSRPSTRAGAEAMAWCGAAVLESSTHWSSAVAASTIALGIGAYLRRQRPVVAAVLLAVGLLVQSELGLAFDSPDSPYVPLVFSIVLAYSLGSRCGLERALAGLIVLLVALSGGFLWYTAGPIEEALLPVLGLAAPWAAGRVVYSLRRAIRRLAQRSEELEAAQDEISRLSALSERRRLARELHDVVAHGVTLMVVQAGAAERVLRSDRRAAEHALRLIQEAGRDAIEELRQMLDVLGDDEEGDALPAPSASELPELARRVSRAGLDTRLVVDESLQAACIRPDLALALYRMTQEALTNALRRGVTEASVTLRRTTSPGLELEIVTGVARGVAVNGSGRGMQGMQERASLYGGALQAGVLADGRFRILFDLPDGSC